MRREWLTALTTQVHAESSRTYGSRSLRAELTQRCGIGVSGRSVWRLIHAQGVRGLPGCAKAQRRTSRPTIDDPVERRFARSRLKGI